jgi:hypothetical protein
VAYLLKARTVEPKKQPLFGNGCVTCNNRAAVGNGVTSAEDQVPIQDNLETAVRRIEGFYEMATSLRGREPGSRRVSTVASR